MNLQTIRKYTDKLLYAAIILLFVTMFGVTGMNVIMRYCFNKPLAFAVELGRYTFIALVYIGSIFVMRDDGHIGLDIIVNFLPQKVKTLIMKLTRVIVLIYMALFCFQSYRMVMGNWSNRSSSMGIPMSVIYLPLVIGSLGMFIEEFLLLIGYKESADVVKMEEKGGLH